MRPAGRIIGYRRDGRPIRSQAGGAYNACVTEAIDVGLAAWTLDPAACIISASFATTVQYLAGLYYRDEPDSPPVPGNILVPNVVLGSWTNIQAALITMDPIGPLAAGYILAISPAVNAGAAGLNRLVLTYSAAALAALANGLPSGRYWIGWTVAGTLGTALGSPNPGSAQLGLNMGTDAAHTRFGIAAATGVFALGGNVVPGTVTQTMGAGLALCAGLI